MAEYNNEDIEYTVVKGRELTSLLRDYIKLEVIDKGSSLLTFLLTIILVIAFATIAIFCLCMAFYHYLLQATNNPILSYSIIGLIFLVICLLILLLRKSLIENRLIKFLSNKLFNSK